MLVKYASVVETLDLTAAREWGAASNRAAGDSIDVQGIVIQNTAGTADQVEFEFADTNTAWFTINVPATSVVSIDIPFNATRGLRAATAAATVLVTVFYNPQ